MPEKASQNNFFKHQKFVQFIFDQKAWKDISF